LSSVTQAAPTDPLLDQVRRAEFPRVAGSAYLNAASIGALPERARRAADSYNLRRADPARLTGDDFERGLDRARAAAARLVGARAEEIALLPNTSHGINLAAHCLPLEPGQRIVVSAREFPANVYPWMGAERTRGARVEIVPAGPHGRPDEDRLFEALDRGDVGIFALSAVQYVTGHAMDLEAYGRFCRERGIWFVVDAIQALGQLPVDVEAARIDLLATGGHKWLCAPFGTGFAYLRGDLVTRLEPRTVGWTAMQGTLDYNHLADYDYRFWDTARRFEVATQPFQDQAALAESMTLLAEVGPDRIRRHLLALLDPLIDWIRDTGGAEMVSDLRPERRSGILSFIPPDADRAFAALAAAGVSCVLREGAIRLSPHLYNTPEEIAVVIEVLAAEAR
jgi:cysteine desulfurase / selenocysteine lyase